MIHTIHGIVDQLIPEKQVTRSFISRDSYVDYLKSKKGYYKSFDPHNSQINSLMVDDATYAGAEACLVARHYGHEVYLFINPWQIANNQYYFFSILNFALDHRRKDSFLFNDIEFNLNTSQGLKTFRQTVKEKIIVLSEYAALDYVYELAKELLCTNFNLEHFCQTLNLNDLKDLHKIGVRIQSHGWSHRSILALENFEKDLKDSKSWIMENLDIETDMYAVPFGKPNLPLQFDKSIYSYYFLADQSFPLGEVNSRCWNRLDITQTIINKY